LAELHQAYETLDKDEQPERAALLAQYIRRREEEEIDNINGIEHLKLARRRERFAAFLIDLLISLVASIPLWIYFGVERLQQADLALIITAAIYSFVMFIVIHGYFIATAGQTVGKHFLGIRVEDLSGVQATFSRYVFLRYLPMAVAYSIPLIGPLISLIDPLFIFGKSRRCLHDYVAKTQVGYAPQDYDD
jgi:uncharacterized RDD family membrane protein YckC